MGDVAVRFTNAVGRVSVTAKNALSELGNAVAQRLKSERPGSTISWVQFCDSVRDDCDGWKDHKSRMPKRGFSDKTIQRVVTDLRTDK